MTLFCLSPRAFLPRSSNRSRPKIWSFNAAATQDKPPFTRSDREREENLKMYSFTGLDDNDEYEAGGNCCDMSLEFYETAAMPLGIDLQTLENGYQTNDCFQACENIAAGVMEIEDDVETQKVSATSW
eukprot:CAMPEP_0177609602 /NCGR_PEP_ID=MMETSP0419_2-20121207/19197_1 /TAXON_ID=582737 /ORGANISM="Tetraselmis sp., Strain GSL018" /LENGTH=127 /DNA_ID=CAMNT_0019104579 /DNA_START=248 /DNA_END=628 /DNA_ORIENTATION=+